jgi:MoaA/NifB/PqqE/SkfB family radical SAM enzyme
MASSINLKPSNFFPIMYNSLRWHINYYLLGKPFPMIAQFYITHRCNFRCKWCNFWRNPKKDEIPLPKFKQIVSDLGRMGTCYINFTGGEPLLMPDMMERIAFCKKKVPFVHMVSNGFLLTKEKAIQLSKAGIDAVSISINGIGDNYDKSTGVKGSYTHAIEAVKNLKQYAPNVRVSINSIITTTNTAELYQLVKLADELGVEQKFQAICDHPEFEGQATKSEASKTNEKNLDDVKRFIRFILKKKNVLNNSRYLKAVPDYFMGKFPDPIFRKPCTLQYFFCEFFGNGNVSPCLYGSDWKNYCTVGDSRIRRVFRSRQYKCEQKRLHNCKKCAKVMQLCVLEPRFIFPIGNLLSSFF